MEPTEAPGWLEELRAERFLSYDTERFPFEMLFQELFESSELSKLHEKPLSATVPCCPTLLRAYKMAGLKRCESRG